MTLPSASAISAPSRSGAPSRTLKATRVRAGPSARSRAIRAAPGKPRCSRRVVLLGLAQPPAWLLTDPSWAPPAGADALECCALAGAVAPPEEAVVAAPIARHGPRGHQVVDDPAVAVEQDGILLLAGLEVDEVAGGHLLEGGERGDALQPRLAHVG